MKKIVVVIMLLVVSFTMQSQVLISLLLGDKLNSDKIDFGLEGGGNFSTISGMDTKKYTSDWNLGFYFLINLKNSWYVNTGVLVKARNGTGKLTETDLAFLKIDFPDSCVNVEGQYDQKVNYFLVPAMMRYMFKNRFYIEGGVQAGLRYKAWVEYTSDVEDRKVTIKEDNRDLLNPIDVGAIAGVGYRFIKRTGMTLGVKYYYGFTNVYKGVSGTKNSSFYVKLNIPIGAGEKAQKKREAKAKEKEAKKLQKVKEK